MRVSHRVNKSVVAVALTAGALLAPVTTTTANALPPCCGLDTVITYYSTSAKTTVVGRYDDGVDCDFADWGYRTAYYTTSTYYCSTSTEKAS
jgi:hypothetical protein